MDEHQLMDLKKSITEIEIAIGGLPDFGEHEIASGAYADLTEGHKSLLEGLENLQSIVMRYQK